jgi:hypothetical protein
MHPFPSPCIRHRTSGAVCVCLGPPPFHVSLWRGAPHLQQYAPFSKPLSGNMHILCHAREHGTREYARTKKPTLLKAHRGGVSLDLSIYLQTLTRPSQCSLRRRLCLFRSKAVCLSACVWVHRTCSTIGSTSPFSTPEYLIATCAAAPQWPHTFFSQTNDSDLLSYTERYYIYIYIYIYITFVSYTTYHLGVVLGRVPYHMLWSSSSSVQGLGRFRS